MRTSLSTCPACAEALEIRVYGCPSCKTEIQGRFTGCPFCRMSDEERYFCLVFLQCEGSMKDVERVMGISYPTVKNRLLQVRRALGLKDGAPPESLRAPDPPIAPDRARAREVLGALERGEIDCARALDLLKQDNVVTQEKE